jgi:hypothetical protein
MMTISFFIATSNLTDCLQKRPTCQLATGLPIHRGRKHLKTKGGSELQVAELHHLGGGFGPARGCMALTSN